MRSLWFCGGVRVVHHFSFVVISMCPCVLICLCEDVLFTLFVFVYVVCVCLRCLCLFTYGGVQRMLCCGFFFFYVLCTLCCQFLCIPFLIATLVFSNVYVENMYP